MRMRPLLPILLLFAGLLAAPAANAQSEQQEVINGAQKTLSNLHHDKAFGNARKLLPRARAIMVVPKLLKGGFIVGGEGGEGVLMVRKQDGSWSAPAFYAIGSASFGLQAGLEQSEMVLLVMTQKGVNGLLKDQFKVGAQAGISVATLGSGVEGAIGGLTPPDIVVWSSSSGLYGGLTINGSVIRSQPEDDKAFYGRALRTRDILYGNVSSPRAAALHKELSSLE